MAPVSELASVPVSGRTRAGQDRVDAGVGGLRLGDGIAHEADDDYREDEYGKVAVEGRELAQVSEPGNNEVAAQDEDDEGGEIRNEGDGPVSSRRRAGVSAC